MKKVGIVSVAAVLVLAKQSHVVQSTTTAVRDKSVVKALCDPGGPPMQGIGYEL